MVRSKRNKGFFNSQMPLTSKKGRYVLSRPQIAKSLIEAVRESRSDNEAPEKITKVQFSKEIIAELSKM